MVAAVVALLLLAQTALQVVQVGQVETAPLLQFPVRL